MIKDLMSINDYKLFCEDFFTKVEGHENLGKHIKSLSIEQFDNFQKKIFANYYDEKYFVVTDLVKKIRGNFDVFNEDENNDPLKLEENKTLYREYVNVFNEVVAEKFQNLQEFIDKKDNLIAYSKEKRKEESLNIVINDKKHKALAICSVLWSGWECDANAWIIDDNGVKKIINSNHGSLQETDAEFLKVKIAEYQEAIEETQKLLDLYNS